MKKDHSQNPLSEGQLTEIAKLFNLLSEPARLRLISALMPGPRTVGELVSETGLKQGNASKHLGMLLDAELVERQKEGNFARYSIKEPMLFELCKIVCDRTEEKLKERLSSLLGQANQ
ncbi:ArsR/SmtB family transcription factor [Pelagicoccus mobilis]|uniref:Winged helix-turn-helix transcriptional regulator n=1 Tax=Pelagicoccus mobilis TaxID=415221 RepID=A0A934VNG4_9BACT|nr:metalloregulator ArsR/SmtB family transcription factor [Pelagicoccus mobilis]MBK1879921.1 winged helix-turn-helix transcriptional regulator [Pelagicoccus mobilis]